MYLSASLFSTNNQKMINNEQEFGSYSLCDELPDLLKVFQQNFEISTNNGKYKFNKDLIVRLIPNIQEALDKDEAEEEEYLDEYHFDINDEQNVMQKIENLFKGESVEFLKSEEKTIKQITSYFFCSVFPIQMYSIDKFPYIIDQLKDDEIKFPEKITIQINPSVLFNVLKQSRNTFKIKTNQNEYMCNTWGIFSSKKILTYLQTNPTSTEFYFDFDELGHDLLPIINLFNWKKLKIKSTTSDSILSIAEKLEITTLVDQIKQTIKKSEENQQILDPYDELFENLFNINKIGIEKVAHFIIKSKWSATKSDVQEFVSCLHHVIKTSLFLHPFILDLIQMLSKSSSELSSLVDILSNQFLSGLRQNDQHYLSDYYRSVDNSYGFLYQMTRRNLVSTEVVIRKIVQSEDFEYCAFQISSLQSLIPILWFFPEFYDDKRFSHDFLVNFIKKKTENGRYKIFGILSREKMNQIMEGYCIDEILEEIVSKIRLLRDGCGQTNQLIKSIQNDDVDTFQRFVIDNSIDLSKSMKLTIFEGIQKKITFIDYSAFCGSVKCFKYLFLEKVPTTETTFAYAVQGGNSEIIRILEQNNGYTNQACADSMKSAIVYHRNDIFDWLLENTSNIQFYNDLFTTAIENGNGHAISKVYENVKLKDIDKRSLICTIADACKNGFYKIVHFLSNWISFENFFDPLKKNFSEQYFGQEYTYTYMINGAACSGSLKIFNLILENMKEKYSVFLRDAVIEASKIGSIEIIKHVLDDKNYQLSEASFIDAIGNSIENGCDELIDYFIEQKKDLPLITEIISSACKAQNVKLVKRLIQDANEKGIVIDYTKPFIQAVSPCSEEIVKLFIELKVDLDYEEIFSNFKKIAITNHRVIFLLINETKIEIKDRLIMESFKTAISTNNIEVLKFLIARKYEFKDLLINAAMVSNLEVIKIILELNHSEEYINRVGKNGTALFEVLRSPTNKMILQAIDTLPNVYRQPRIDEIIKQKNKIIEYLLKQEGIDPSISIDSINTPLVEATRNGNVEAVGLILDFYGDRIKDQGKQIYDAIDVILEDKGSWRFQENDKLNLKQLLKVRKLAQYKTQVDILYHAIVRDDKDMVSELLDSDKSIDLRKKFANGDTYLHLAISDGNISRITEIHRLLINHPGIDINSQNALNETPLVKAIKFKNEALVDLILNHPKFDAKLSLIDYAFMLSVKLENTFMKIIKIESLDVNYNHVTTVSKEPENRNGDQSEPKIKITTPLIEAVKTGNLQNVKAIINHSSFDPIKSQIQTCLITAIKRKNLELFKFFIELNGGDVNLKSISNKSLLYFAASAGGNSEILKAILGNEKFDPIKSDIQKSFMNSTDPESKKILVSYDEDHKTNFLNFDKIYLLFSFHREIQHFRIDPLQLKFQNSYEFLMRKNGLLPMIPSICTSVALRNDIYQRTYYCATCYAYNICEICARVCHKGHEIHENGCNSFKNTCLCRHFFNCKCKSISNVHDELYGKFKAIKKKENRNYSYCGSNELEEDEDEDDYINKKEHKIKDEECLKCTLDLAGFNSMSQPMYRCRNCKVDICQSCAIRCHKGHKLTFKGLKNNESCHCFEMTDCCCTSRKDVVCTCAFYGKQYVYQPFYNCESCRNSEDIGCCAACCKKCHHNHNYKFKHRSDCFCDCGAHDLPVHCNAMIFPPFNHLSSCTNREQKYQKKMQRLYHCLTCGLTAENQGICEACAIHCHPAHKLVYIGMKEFACECLLLNIECKAPSCPEISSDGLCNRVKFGKNTISPAFICESCDKDGKNRICKSCALNCHKGHDVHFLEFSNFECQCNPCKCNENKS